MTMRRPTESGYALVSIIAIGASSLIFLMALATIVTNSTRAVAANKYVESLRNAAETGIDYTVSRYNTEFPCPLDPGTQDPTGKTATFTTTLLPDSPYLQALPATSGAPNITVTIKVTELTSPSDWQMLSQMSPAYLPQLDPNLVKMPLNVPDGGYRIVESTANNGILSRTVRVILMAQLGPPPPNLPGQTPVPPPTTFGAQPSSYFNAPMLSNQTLNIQPQSGPLSIQGYNSQTQTDNPIHTVTPVLQGQASYNAYDLNIQTNQNVIVGAASSQSSTIYGDVTVANSSSPGQVASTQNGLIEGRLIANGNVDQGSVLFSPNAPKPGVTDTVLANADISSPLSTRVGQNLTAPVLQSQSTTASALVAAASPTTASTLAPLANIANSTQPTQPNGQPPPPPTIAAGQYATQGLTTDGINTPLVIQNNASTPVTLFVNSGGSSPTVDIDTSKLTFANPNVNAGNLNADARNFQIVYEGSAPVNINVASSGKPFTGLIYAPNSTVTVSGNGVFSGAVVAGQLNVTMAGTMKIYTDLNATSGSAGAANIAAGLQTFIQPGVKSGTFASFVRGWQPITWQEFTTVTSF